MNTNQTQKTTRPAPKKNEYNQKHDSAFWQQVTHERGYYAEYGSIKHQFYSALEDGLYSGSRFLNSRAEEAEKEAERLFYSKVLPAFNSGSSYTPTTEDEVAEAKNFYYLIYGDEVASEASEAEEADLCFTKDMPQEQLPYWLQEVNQPVAKKVEQQWEELADALPNGVAEELVEKLDHTGGFLDSVRAKHIIERAKADRAKEEPELAQGTATYKVKWVAEGEADWRFVTLTELEHNIVIKSEELYSDYSSFEDDDDADMIIAQVADRILASAYAYEYWDDEWRYNLAKSCHLYLKLTTPEDRKELGVDVVISEDCRLFTREELAEFWQENGMDMEADEDELLKQELLQLAESGAPKPEPGTKLGDALVRFTTQETA